MNFLKWVGVVLIIMSSLYSIIIIVIAGTKKSTQIKTKKVKTEVEEYAIEKQKLANYAFDNFLKRGIDYEMLTRDVSWSNFEKLANSINALFTIVTDKGSFTFQCEHGSVFKVGSNYKKRYKG